MSTVPHTIVVSIPMMRSALARKRQAMPWTVVPEYKLDGADGPTTLSALFGDSDQLIV